MAFHFAAAPPARRLPEIWYVFVHVFTLKTLKSLGKMALWIQMPEIIEFNCFITIERTIAVPEDHHKETIGTEAIVPIQCVVLTRMNQSFHFDCKFGVMTKVTSPRLAQEA